MMTSTTSPKPIQVDYVTAPEVHCARCRRLLGMNLKGSVELKCRGCKLVKEYSS